MEGKTQETAAAKAGMCVRSARKWQDGPLPSETRQERLSRASTKRTTAAEECCTTWVMPDGHGLAGGVGGPAWTVGPALARR